jgi:hypothetical protein
MQRVAAAMPQVDEVGRGFELIPPEQLKPPRFITYDLPPKKRAIADMGITDDPHTYLACYDELAVVTGPSSIIRPVYVRWSGDGDGTIIGAKYIVTLATFPTVEDAVASFADIKHGVASKTSPCDPGPLAPAYNIAWRFQDATYGAWNGVHATSRVHDLANNTNESNDYLTKGNTIIASTYTETNAGDDGQVTRASRRLLGQLISRLG